MTLREFLLARIAEDETDAHIRADTRRAVALAERSAFGESYMVVGGAFDPARVLAECEAKRRLLALHMESPYYGLDRYGRWLPHEGEPKAWYCECQTEDGLIGGHAPCETSRILALPYADHPDYHEEWRP